MLTSQKWDGGDTINKVLFKMILEREGYTQKEFAKKMGYSKNTLNNKVNGRVKIYTDEAVKMCDILKIVSDAEKCKIFLNDSSQKWDEKEG